MGKILKALALIGLFLLLIISCSEDPPEEIPEVECYRCSFESRSYQCDYECDLIYPEDSLWCYPLLSNVDTSGKEPCDGAPPDDNSTFWSEWRPVIWYIGLTREYLGGVIKEVSLEEAESYCFGKDTTRTYRMQDGGGRDIVTQWWYEQYRKVEFSEIVGPCECVRFTRYCLY